MTRRGCNLIIVTLVLVLFAVIDVRLSPVVTAQVPPPHDSGCPESSVVDSTSQRHASDRDFDHGQ